MQQRFFLAALALPKVLMEPSAPFLLFGLFPG